MKSNKNKIAKHRTKHRTKHRAKNVSEPGSFDWISDRNIAILLESAYKVVSLVNGWEFLANYNFPNHNMFADPPLELQQITNKIAELNDSDADFPIAWILRQMQHIANHGWITYIRDCTREHVRLYGLGTGSGVHLGLRF